MVYSLTSLALATCAFLLGGSRGIMIGFIVYVFHHRRGIARHLLASGEFLEQTVNRSTGALHAVETGFSSELVHVDLQKSISCERKYCLGRNIAYVRFGLEAVVHDAEQIELALGKRRGGRLGGHVVGFRRVRWYRIGDRGDWRLRRTEVLKAAGKMLEW